MEQSSSRMSRTTFLLTAKKMNVLSIRNDTNKISVSFLNSFRSLSLSFFFTLSLSLSLSSPPSLIERRQGEQSRSNSSKNARKNEARSRRVSAGHDFTKILVYFLKRLTLIRHRRETRGSFVLSNHNYNIKNQVSSSRLR